MVRVRACVGKFPASSVALLAASSVIGGGGGRTDGRTDADGVPDDGLLSIVRPIIYSQLKVHRASERPRRRREGRGRDAIPRAMHGVLNKLQGLVGFSSAAIWDFRLEHGDVGSSHGDYGAV